jgi:hypothetical protein
MDRLRPRGSISNGPGFNDAQKRDKVSLQSGTVVTLTKTSFGGFHPDWQPRHERSSPTGTSVSAPAGWVPAA